MEAGNSVRVTSPQLGGWDNSACQGRASYTVQRGDIGTVVKEATWISPDEPWYIVRFVKGDNVVFVPCAEPDHVEVV